MNDNTLVNVGGRVNLMEAASALASLRHKITSSPCTTTSEEDISVTTVESDEEASVTSAVIDEDASVTSNSSTDSPIVSSSLSEAEAKTIITFPEQLMDVLDNDEISHIISWTPDGQSFIILSPNKFTLEVLPRFFKKRCEFSSFTRKLYWWGFRKMRGGSGADSYRHELFQRGKRELCKLMQTKDKTQKKTKVKKESPTKSLHKKAHSKNNCIKHRYAMNKKVLGQTIPSLAHNDLKISTQYGLGFNTIKKPLPTNATIPFSGSAVINAAIARNIALTPTIIPSLNILAANRAMLQPNFLNGALLSLNDAQFNGPTQMLL